MFDKKSYTAAKIDKGLSVTQLLEILSIFCLKPREMNFFPHMESVIKN